MKHFKSIAIVVLIFVILILGFLLSRKSAFNTISLEPIKELQSIPQNFKDLNIATQLVSDQTENRYPSLEHFLEMFFWPWLKPTPFLTNDEIEKKILSFESFYGENYQPRTKEWIRAQIENANLATLNTLKQYGVAIRTTDLRIIPTSLPCFEKPNTAGEGYPFDYLQVTRLFIGQPFIISHYSKDKAWAYVEAQRNGQGWIKVSDLALVSPEYKERISKSPLAVMTHDGDPLFDNDGNFLEYTATGMILPILKSEQEYIEILLPIRGASNDAQWITAKISKQKAIDKPMSLSSAADVERAFNELIGNPYGWGSFLGNRDCSAMIRDFYAMFHLLMSPWSQSVEGFGRTEDISKLSRKEKFEFIKTKGKPFRTLLSKPGHVGIYIGIYNNEPLMFHSIWGVRTKEGASLGRNIVGRSVVTRLDFEKNQPDADENAFFIDSVTQLIILGI